MLKISKRMSVAMLIVAIVGGLMTVTGSVLSYLSQESDKRELDKKWKDSDSVRQEIKFKLDGANEEIKKIKEQNSELQEKLDT